MTSICFQDIHFEYKEGTPIFKGLSFTINRSNSSNGYIIGLMGDSGSGKTTLIRLLLGIERPNKGRILMDDDSQDSIISYMPQEPVLFEHLKPIDNSKYFYWTNRYRNRYNDDLFGDLSNVLDMNECLTSAKSIRKISGGQKQRLALLRALSIEPDILILDEPLTGMDNKIKETFLKTLVDFSHKKKTLIIYATHHKSEVELIANEVIYLVKDENDNCVKSVHQKNTQEFFMGNPPTLSAMYLSKAHDTNILPFMKKDDNSGWVVSPIQRQSVVHEEDSIICSDCEYDISIPPNTLKFSDDSGLSFNIIFETGVFSHVKLIDSEQVIVVSSETIKDKRTQKYVYFEGEINIFRNGIFYKKAEISFSENNLFKIKI